MKARSASMQSAVDGNSSGMLASANRGLFYRALNKYKYLCAMHRSLRELV
jgi:hypothetical protein